MAACVGLATVYVGALYIVTPREHRASRDDPVYIRRRTAAVTAATAFGPCMLAAIAHEDVMVVSLSLSLSLSLPCFLSFFPSFVLSFFLARSTLRRSRQHVLDHFHIALDCGETTLD